MYTYILELTDEEERALQCYADANECSKDEAVNRILKEAIERIDEADRCMKSIEDYERTGQSTPISEIAKKYDITQNEH